MLRSYFSVFVLRSKSKLYKDKKELQSREQNQCRNKCQLNNFSREDFFVTRDILPRSDIARCARLRPYLHKKYPSTESYANEEAHSIFAVF